MAGLSVRAKAGVFRRMTESLGAPRGVTVSIIVFLAGAISLAVAFLPLPQLHALISRYPGFSRLDDQTAYLFDQLEQFDRRGEQADHVDIAWLGGSTAREALWSPKALADQIEAHTGAKARVYDMTSSGQLMLTSWALASRTACNGADIVAVGVNVNRLVKTQIGNPAFLIGAIPEEVSEFLQAARAAGRPFKGDAAAILGFRAGLVRGATLDALDGMFRRIMSRGPGRPAPRHWYLGKQENKAALARSLAWFESISGNPLVEADTLKGLSQSVTKCGSRLVIFTGTLTPDLLDASRYPGSAAAIASLPDKLRQIVGPHVPIFEMNVPGMFAASDFYDWGHLADKDAIGRATSFSAEKLALIVAQMSFEPRS